MRNLSRRVMEMTEYTSSHPYEIIYLGEDEVFRVATRLTGLPKQKEQIGR